MLLKPFSPIDRPELPKDPSSAPTPTLWRYGVQLFIAFVLVEGALWSSTAFGIVLWSAAAVAWMLLTTLIPAHSRADLGLSWTGLRGSWLLPLSIACAGAAVGFAWYSGTLHPAFGSSTRPWHYAVYAFWALGQQFILQSYFFVRLEHLLASSSRAVIVCALLFALVHLPNHFLALITFVGGLVFCDVFRKYRSIYPLGVAHAVWGLCIAVTLSSDLHHNMRVGRGFLNDVSSASTAQTIDKERTYTPRQAGRISAANVFATP